MLLLIACFNQPEISTPMFVEKSAPDSLYEKGIDAAPDNSIYLEWEEPSAAEEEGIVGYYLFRGVVKEDEYQFKKIATIERENGIIFKSDEYTDYDVNLDTLYYYYLRSFNDFTMSVETSDTAKYQLAYPASLTTPKGDVLDSVPRFEFQFPQYGLDNITHFYFRLYHLETDGYKIKYFSKIKRFDLGRVKFSLNLGVSSQYSVILYDSLWGTSSNKYLIKGVYRWRIDTISSRLGGAPEYIGSESDWMEFTIK